MMTERWKTTTDWAASQWTNVEIGDKRRTARAVQLGAALAATPEASLPMQTGSWGDLKAAYRLLNQPAVTHTALSEPHWVATRDEAGAQARVLFIQDTTELDFSAHTGTTGLGHIGDTWGRGFEMQSCLAVRPDEETPEILGLAAQKVWTRHGIHKGSETREQRRQRTSQADMWAEIVEAVGRPPENCLWVNVSDRASDVFSFLRRTQALGWQCLIRACQDRCIMTPDGRQTRLFAWARALPEQATTPVVLRGRTGEATRTIAARVAWDAVTIQPPRLGPERTEAPIDGWCIRCWHGEDVEWILFTTVPLMEVDALTQVTWYSRRWLIEEYHKCLKTGCRMEDRQLTTAEGLTALLGFLAIVAVRLLQLRTLARQQPTACALDHLPPAMVTVVATRLNLPPSTLTIRAFWQGVARFGGFIGRARDGDPGWQTLWRGWQRLQDMCWGMTLATERP